MKLSYVKVRFAAYFALDLLSLAAPRGRMSNEVLIVRQDAIGDFVMWLDAAHALVEHYRREGRKITLLANKAWAGWAQELGIFDSVIAFDVKAFQYDMRYRIKMNRTIRQIGFGVAIQPVYSGTTRLMCSYGCPAQRIELARWATDRTSVPMKSGSRRGATQD